jgi:HlyD family secretion protein
VIDPQDPPGHGAHRAGLCPELRPGGFASAKITAGTVVAPMLPESAILSDDKGSFVYIVGKDNKVERRAVKTGLVTADGIAVVEGLNGNERSCCAPAAFLQPGETVKPRAATK